MYSECESTYIPPFTIVYGVSATYLSGLIGMAATETWDGYFVCIGVTGYIGAIMGSLVDSREMNVHMHVTNKELGN